ncbi:hypothetical protein [uncultured Ruegeria sp.]|uniref:hypothetical protein n=1 Tax=uncultured Ruegeria sp. TaxID=259304 RepID=UPI002634C1FF|nr:hypothetical protein [uncultured Ruegeria sp.]
MKPDNFGAPPGKPVSDEERFADLLDPLWSSADDYYLVTERGQGKRFAFIAGELGRNRVTAESRWQRLKAVDDIEELLLRYGLSDMRYCRSLPEDYRLPSEPLDAKGKRVPPVRRPSP